MWLTVSNPVLIEIGKIATLHSQITAAVKLFIHAMDSVNFNRKILRDVAASSEIRLGEMLIAKFGMSHEYTKEYKTIQRELEKYRHIRNTFQHSMWAFGPNLKEDSASIVNLEYDQITQKITNSTLFITLQELQETSAEMSPLV